MTVIGAAVRSKATAKPGRIFRQLAANIHGHILVQWDTAETARRSESPMSPSLLTITTLKAWEAAPA
jgi:hypothetical protein